MTTRNVREEATTLDLSRREFIKTTAVAAGAIGVAGVLGASGQNPTSTGKISKCLAIKVPRTCAGRP